MKVEIPIVSREECRIRYKAEYEPGLPRAITRNMFCAGYIEDNEVFNEKDTCSGDSGGPVVDSKTGTLIGVVSWGAEGCGTDGLLGVNARVGSVRDFIDRYL
jgi:trypsin